MIQTKNKKVVTRMAPSPTGLCHIGNLRSALYNYLFAKKMGGEFYLRIEDTDQKRFVESAEQYIKDSLDWFGIIPDHSPWNPRPEIGAYRQSERDYSKHIAYLIDNGFAYYAFDTADDLAKAHKETPNFAYGVNTRMSMKNSLTMDPDQVMEMLDNGTPYTIRFKVPTDKKITFTDIIRGEITFDSNLCDDKVLVKSNGIPTYHMANVCDDHDMGTTHVIRGEEWVSSTPLHIMLYDAFGWDLPEFAHLPLLLNPDGKGKLSKRHSLKYGFPVFPFGGEAEDDKGNMVKYKGFKDEGFDPDAVLNFLMLLGWAPQDGQEVMNLDEMIEKFDLSAVHKAGARFDIDKAKWFNQTYLHQKRSDSELIPFIETNSDYHYDDQKMSKIVELSKNRSIFKSDLNQTAKIFFNPVTVDKTKSTDDYKKVFTNFVDDMDNLNWDSDTIKTKIMDICNDKGVKMGKVMPSLRMALTGGLPGPDLITVMDVLGRKETKARIMEMI